MLSHNNEKTFQFSLDKTVYFKQDYEISEMRKISLDPDIIITPEDDYVHINGLIMLQGEYEKATDNSERKVRDETTLNIVTKLTDLENGLVKFNHHFPIDITVPAYRVANLSDVSVAIESFDYELPEPDELIITSNIEINGIHTESREEKQVDPVNSSLEEDQPVEQREHNEINYEADEHLVSADINEQKPLKNERPSEPELSVQEQPELVQKEVDQMDNQIEQEDRTEEKKKKQLVESVVENKAEERAKDITSNEQQVDNNIEVESSFKEEKSRSVEEEKPVAQDVNIEQEETTKEDSEIVEERIEDTIDETSSIESESVEDVNDVDEQEEVAMREEDLELEDDDEQEQSIDIQVKESEEEQDDVEDVHFLTTIFNRANEESYDQLRIYIVQDGDTVHSIAKHYDVSSLKLLQLNDLSGDDLSTGQLLYLPERLESKS